MRLLLLSDIHANLEALEAVLAAVPPHDLVANLGDIVGYNASPNEVVERVLALGGLVVRGNHDRACSGLLDLNTFNPIAAISTRWTQMTLDPAYIEWLRLLPEGPVRREAIPDVEFVHGAPVDEDEYLLSTMSAEENFRVPDQPGKMFFGHTHLQGGFIEEDGQVRQFAPTYESIDGIVKFELPLRKGARYLINPGSVGQPRDGDWRAAFAIYENYEDAPGRVTFYRIPYDIDQAQERILAMNLPPRLAIRLRVGR
jgi:diadenosine tetraphosphatase ApaH/serine/threonine PP2A family protein phosphatase